MYRGAEIEVKDIGRVIEISLAFVPNWLGKLLGAKRSEMIFRGQHDEWFSFPSGNRVEEKMKPFLNNVFEKWAKETYYEPATKPMRY